MRHYHIIRVLYIAMAIFLVSAGIFFVLYLQTTPAKALPLFTPFGGVIDGVPTPNKNPACPLYYTVSNVDLDDEFAAGVWFFYSGTSTGN